MDNRIYSLYKRIMKRHPEAINEIESLEDAKEIIRLMTGNVYLNGKIYQMEQKCYGIAYVDENGKGITKELPYILDYFGEDKDRCLSMARKFTENGCNVTPFYFQRFDTRKVDFQFTWKYVLEHKIDI